MAKLTLADLAGGYLSIASVNANNALITTAMDNTLSRDGSTPNVMSADIDMNSSGRITNLQNAVQNQEPLTLGQSNLLVGVTNPLTQDTVAAVLWPESSVETANGSTATELQFYYGNVRRYGAKVDGSTDDTTAFNTAIDSGYDAYCDEGTAAISGTISIGGNTSINGGKTLILSSLVILQRFAGSATTPMIHMFGHNNHLVGNGATVRQNLYDHPDGVVLLGPSPGDADVPGDSNIATHNNNISGLKIVGPENTANEKEAGHPGLYIHSAARKKGIFVGVTTYKNVIYDMDIINCDVLVEFSSDANANSMFHVHLRQWIKAALFFNGSYGNTLYGVKMESPLENITPSATERFAIHLVEINDGVETGTDATYAIPGAYFNSIRGFAELPNSGNKVLRLFKISEPGSGAFGRNDIDFVGTLAGGIGADGSSKDSSVGFNSLRAGGAHKDVHNKLNLQGVLFRPLDDDSGTHFGKDSWRVITGRKDNIAEATQENIFLIDNIGTTTAGFLIKLMYAGKADTVTSAQMGEITWAVWLEGTVTYDSRILSQSSTSFDETRIFDFNVVLAAGTIGSSMKATFGFLTTAPAGTNDFFVSWKAELLSTNLEGTNVDLDRDIQLL